MAHRERADGLVGFALTMPLVVLIVLVGVEFTFWLHAQDVVITAAQEGARAAAHEGGSAADGQQAAQALLRDGLGASANRVGVQVQVGADTVVVDARGTWPVLASMDGAVDAPLHARATLTREQFRPFVAR